MLEILPDGSVNNLQIENNKALSCLCKYLAMSDKNSLVTVNDIASALNITPQSFRNKLTRNSFSINDLLIIADMVGASVQVHTSYGSTITLEIKDFLDENTYNNYQNFCAGNRQLIFDEILKMSKGLTEDEMQQLIDARKADLQVQKSVDNKNTD